MFLYHCLCVKKHVPDRTSDMNACSCIIVYVLRNRTEHQIWMHVPVSLFMCYETGQNIRYECMFLYHCLCVMKQQDRTSDMNACSCIIVYVLRNRTEHQIWMHVPVSLFMCNETGQNIRYECMFLYHCLCVKKQDRTSDMNACSCIIVYVLMKQNRTSDMNACSCIIVYVLRNRTEHQIWMHVPVSLFMC